MHFSDRSPVSPTVPPATSDRYHHGDLERALIRAGLDLLETGGLSAVGIRAAARAVGVSHAAPARHFPDATSYLAALATEAYTRLAVAEEEAAAAHPHPLAAVRAVGVAYITFGIEQPHLFRLLTNPSLADRTGHPALAAASLRAFIPLRTAIEGAQRAGSVNDTDPAVLALGAWAAVHGITQLIVDDQLRPKGYSQTPDEITELVLGVLLAGLRPG
jgi:AcrR family transcriptional regulator